MRHAEAAARDRGLRVDQLADRASVSPRTLQRSFADHVISVGLLAGGTGWPSLGSSPTDDEVTVGQFEELSGLDIPESATAVVTEPVPGSSVGALRARFTILEADLAPFCGTSGPALHRRGATDVRSAR